MSVSLKDFNSYALHFLNISDKLNDGWKKCDIENNTEFYLHKSMVKTENVTISNSHESFTWDYSIVYSHSYFVPVLYFNVYNASNELMELEKVWELIHPLYKNLPISQKWNTISQNEHPYLRQPFFMLHPCKTEIILKNHNPLESGINLLVTWLSTLGSVVGMSLAPDYGLTKFAFKQSQAKT